MGVITITNVPSGAVFGPLLGGGGGGGGSGSGVGSGGGGGGSIADPVSHVGTTIRDRRNGDEESTRIDVLSPRLDASWLRHVSPARDAREQNLEAIGRDGGRIFYRSIREIRADEELRVWYGRDLENLLGIPEIQPFCVKDGNTFVCSFCGELFLFPHTLRAHMRFSCRMRSRGAFAFLPQTAPTTPPRVGVAEEAPLEKRRRRGSPSPPPKRPASTTTATSNSASNGEEKTDCNQNLDNEERRDADDADDAGNDDAVQNPSPSSLSSSSSSSTRDTDEGVEGGSAFHKVSRRRSSSGLSTEPHSPLTSESDRPASPASAASGLFSPPAAPPPAASSAPQHPSDFLAHLAASAGAAPHYGGGGGANILAAGFMANILAPRPIPGHAAAAAAVAAAAADPMSTFMSRYPLFSAAAAAAAASRPNPYLQQPRIAAAGDSFPAPGVGAESSFGVKSAAALPTSAVKSGQDDAASTAASVAASAAASAAGPANEAPLHLDSIAPHHPLHQPHQIPSGRRADDSQPTHHHPLHLQHPPLPPHEHSTSNASSDADRRKMFYNPYVSRPPPFAPPAHGSGSHHNVAHNAHHPHHHLIVNQAANSPLPFIKTANPMVEKILNGIAATPAAGGGAGGSPAAVSGASAGGVPVAGPPSPLLPSLASPPLPPPLPLTMSAQNWCAKCNASFRMTSDLVYHMRSHHKREFDVNKKRREDKLRCKICGEAFRERHHLTRHMTSHL